MLQTIDITNEIRLSIRRAANIFITIAESVFLKLATLLYKNVEKLNAQYGAQAWFTVFKINQFYNNNQCKQQTDVFMCAPWINSIKNTFYRSNWCTLL